MLRLSCIYDRRWICGWEAAVCGVLSKLVEAMVTELTDYAATCVVRPIVRTLLILWTIPFLDSGLMTCLHYLLLSCGSVLSARLIEIQHCVLYELSEPIDSIFYWQSWNVDRHVHQYWDKIIAITVSNNPIFIKVRHILSSIFSSNTRNNNNFQPATTSKFLFEKCV